MSGMLETIVGYVVLPILSIGLMFVFVRLIRGPTVADRVVALDLMTTMGVGFIAAYAVVMDEPMLLDIAAVVALISFLGTVAVAYYLAQRT